MSKWVVILTIVIMGMVGSGTVVALDGSGTEGDPWLIQSLEDFNDFAADANYWDDYTRLETDVNLAGMVYDRAVIAWDDAFTGVFDGNDHKIANLTIDSNGLGRVGLFGYIFDPNAKIKKLGLIDPNITGGFGTLVDYLRHGTITDCYVQDGSVAGSGAIGGLVGTNDWDGTITNCYSTVSVSGTSWNIGGLVGDNWGTISNCYSTGTVSGTGYSVGGLVGTNDYDGTITNCYSTGSVAGNRLIGGLVGYNVPGQMISASFWDIETSGEPNMCGSGEDEYDCDNSNGKITAEMKQQSTFTNWDFINVWNIGEKQTYPYLRVYLPSDINKDGITNFLDVAITANKWLQEQ